MPVLFIHQKQIALLAEIDLRLPISYRHICAEGFQPVQTILGNKNIFPQIELQANIAVREHGRVVSVFRVHLDEGDFDCWIGHQEIVSCSASHYAAASHDYVKFLCLVHVFSGLNILNGTSNPTVDTDVLPRDIAGVI